MQAFQKVWPALQGLGAQFRSIGGDLIRGLINGLMGGLPGILSSVADIGGKVVSALKNKLGIRSPSRVFAALGDDTIAGLAQGLNRSSGSAIDSVSRIGAGMTAALAVGSGAPALAFDHGPQIGTSVPVAAGAAPALSMGPVTINIYAQPGQSTMDIAQEVKSILEGSNLSGFGDDPEGFD